ELGEIEGTLRTQRGVRDAVVRAYDDAAGGKQLVAYVVPQRPNQALWGWQAPYVLPDGSPVAHLNRNETEYIYNEIFVQQAYLRHGVTIRDGGPHLVRGPVAALGLLCRCRDGARDGHALRAQSARRDPGRRPLRGGRGRRHREPAPGPDGIGPAAHPLERHRGGADRAHRP